MLTPGDIEDVKLPRAVAGGYKMQAVTALLRQVAWDFRRLLEARETMEEEVRLVRGHLVKSERRRDLEGAVLNSAQEAAREIREAARHEAELIVKKAREHATELRKVAENEYAARSKELRQIEELSRLIRTELRVQLKSVLEALGEPAGLVGDQRGDDQRADDRHGGHREQRSVMADLAHAVQAARASALDRIPSLASDALLSAGDGGGVRPADEPPLPADDPAFEEGERVA